MFGKKKDTKKAAVEFKNAGNTAFQQGKFKEAIDLYTKAMKADPADATFYSNRCAAYVSLENYQKALEDAEQCIKLNPTWSKGYYRKGTVLMTLKRDQEAQQVFREGLKQEAGNQDLKKKLEEVTALLSRVPKKTNTDGTPLSPAQLAKEEGNLHYKESRYEQAIQSYTKAIESTKDENEKATFYANRAAARAQLQMYSEVIADCHACLEIQPNNVKALLRRGLAYENKEIWKLARADMQKALSLEPSSMLASEALVRLDRNIRMHEKIQATEKKS